MHMEYQEGHKISVETTWLIVNNHRIYGNKDQWSGDQT